MKASRHCAVCLLVLALPLSGTSSRVPRAEIVRHVLGTGLTVLVRPEPEATSISIHVFVRTDASVVRGGEHIGPVVLRGMFFGNTNLSGESMARSIVDAGGFLQTRWQPDFAHIECRTTAAGLDEALYAVSQALAGAELSESDLRQARSEAAVEASAEETEPRSVAYAAAREALYPEGPYRLPFAGSKFRVERVSVGEARNYFRRVFTPANTVIAVAGKVRPAKLLEQIELKFGQYRRQGSSSFEQPTVVGIGDTTTLNRVTTSGNRALVALCPMPGVLSPEYPAARLVATILGGGKANRLYRKLRDRLGAGYAVGADLPLLARQSHVRAFLERDSRGVTREENDRVQSEFLEALRSMAAEPVSERELRRAKAFLKGGILIERQRLRDRAYFPGWLEAIGAGYESDGAQAEKLDSVTLEDVRRLASTSCKSWVICSAGPGM